MEKQLCLKSMRLENFQSHKDNIVEFHPNFNVIVGLSNVGKTSITRALDFILFGTWDSSWVKYGESFCRISLTTNTGVEVIREKGPKRNKYILKTLGQEDQVYENFGTAVPEPISLVLGVHEAKIDKNDFFNLTLSSQFDPIFLITKPGAFKAKAIGRLSGSHYLDFAIRELNKDKRALSSERTIQFKSIEALEDQVAKFSSLPKLQELFTKIETKAKSIEENTQRLEKLKALLQRTKDWKTQYIEEERKLALLESVNGVELDSLGVNLESTVKIRTLDSKLERVNAEIIYLNSELTILETSTAQAKNNYIKKMVEHGKCPTCNNVVNKNMLESVI